MADMRCNRCNKEGAKPYKYKDNGSVYDVYLCDECFARLSAPAEYCAEPRVSEAVRGGKGSILGMERRCPSCGTSLASIRKTGYLGCGNCFKYFRGELAQTVDKFQNGILSSPEKRQRELSIILLEDEYFALIERRNRRPNELGAISARLKEIERQLAELGVRVDE